jgi:hypothetical protein
MKCLNCDNEAVDGNYCSVDCFMERDGFTYTPPKQPRFVIKRRHPHPTNDFGQGPSDWLYDTKNNKYVREAISL